MHSSRWLLGSLLSLLFLSLGRSVRAEEAIDFVKDVRPIFVAKCYSCHSDKKQRGSLRLDIKKFAFEGGDRGKAIVPGKSSASPLIRLVSGTDEDRVMPPKGERLTPEQIAILRKWIDQGATWPDGIDAVVVDKRDWWSLKPIVLPELPALAKAEHVWVRNPVDAFVLRKLREKGLGPAPEADRRTLIRRLTFDLHGLPPTPSEVEAFCRDDSPGAYERLVDRLLASPRYGERWARHWLDVVHYGDTHGYDKDKPRPNAWPYRDYVIRAFNEDKPYSRFVREQIAGDVLYPDSPDGIVATGFIAAGPWDFIGHAEVPETKIDGKIARHLDRDDMVANTMGTFVSLTVQCAQCHDHKFDPIPQEDYYSVQAVFAALDRADRPYHRDARLARRYVEKTVAQRDLTEQKQKLERTIATKIGQPLAELDKQIAEARRTTPKGLRPEYGYHSQIVAKQTATKWVQVDLGRDVSMHKVIVAGCYDNFNNIGAGFGFPVRFKIEASNDPDFARDVRTLVDRTQSDFANPGVAPQRFVVSERARYVRVTATKLALRKNDYIFALSELRVLDEEGQNLAKGSQVSALDSIEAPVRWRRSNLVDDIYPGRTETTSKASLAELLQRRKALLRDSIDRQTREDLAKVERDLDSVNKALKTLPMPSMVYAGTVHRGKGNFRGTGPDGGRPREIHVLLRGDITQPSTLAEPGGLSAIADLPARFPLGKGHSEGDRRAALARWLTDVQNPLPWRSIVNRVWQYHFGQGLVASPNDFGRMGRLPSHPELLDWLAHEFRDGDHSLKRLHRLLVTSATYRQSSRLSDWQQANAGSAIRDPHSVDANNVYLWKSHRRRLEAEAIRDAALFVSGMLRPQMYGPGFRDFVIEKPQHSPHYQYHLHDPADVRAHRRAVYRFLVRSQQQPFMTTLDCADPSMRVAKRNQTVTPQQALALLNNGFMLVTSKQFAQRLGRVADTTQERIDFAFRAAFGRPPSQVEIDTLSSYTKEHGLANTCRVLFNLNEFAYVD